MLVGHFNVEPTAILCLAKGISAVLWVDLESAWALACSLSSLASVPGVLLVRWRLHGWVALLRRLPSLLVL